MILRDTDIDSALASRARQRALIEGRGPRVNEFLLNPHRFGGGGGSTQAALLHFEGTNGSTTFTDVSGKSWSSSGATISTAQFAAGSASGLFNAAGQNVQTANSTDFDFGGGDFTIEVSCRPTATTAASQFWGLISKRSTHTAVNSWCFGVRDANAGFFFEYSTSGTANASTVNTSNTLNTSTWYTVAVSRIGTSLYMLVNGVLQTTSTIGSAVLATVNAPTCIGISGYSQTTAFNTWQGYIDEVRVTKGLGRYSGNYTVSLPYP